MILVKDLRKSTIVYRSIIILESERFQTTTTTITKITTSSLFLSSFLFLFFFSFFRSDYLMDRCHGQESEREIPREMRNEIFLALLVKFRPYKGQPSAFHPTGIRSRGLTFHKCSLVMRESIRSRSRCSGVE